MGRRGYHPESPAAPVPVSLPPPPLPGDPAHVYRVQDTGPGAPRMSGPGPTSVRLRTLRLVRVPAMLQGGSAGDTIAVQTRDPVTDAITGVRSWTTLARASEDITATWLRDAQHRAAWLHAPPAALATDAEPVGRIRAAIAWLQAHPDVPLAPDDVATLCQSPARIVRLEALALAAHRHGLLRPPETPQGLTSGANDGSPG